MPAPYKSVCVGRVKVSQVMVRPLPINLRRTLCSQGGPDIPTIHTESQRRLKGRTLKRKETVTE